MKKTKLQRKLKSAINSVKESGGYWKWKLLPSPVKLGMAKTNALGSRKFGSKNTGATWEDWEEKVKNLYPVRYFFIEQLYPWIRSIYYTYIYEVYYWFKCNFIHRYHMLDLRQPKPNQYGINYRYGKIDSDSQMLYALFKIFNNFVEKEFQYWPFPTEDDVAINPYLSQLYANVLEIKAIHYWWNVDRVRQNRKYSDLLETCGLARKNEDATENSYKLELDKMEKDLSEKEEEMILRLLKIRKSLWY